MSTSSATLSDYLLSTLPLLRRYARALIGDQARGDEWVRLCAEVLMEQPRLLGDGTRSKLEIFALFHRLQRSFGSLEGSEDAPDDGGPADRLKARIQNIAGIKRQVLLLTALEDFSLEEAAHILDIAPDRAAEALREAREELRRAASVRVLIVEDEAVIALDLAQTVRSAGHEVVGIAATERSAIEQARERSPDLIIADIQLRGDNDGIAAVRQILKSTSVPVIFVTGFPERLLTGRGVEPAFVITKPFAPEHLKTVIAQALDIAAA